MRLDNDLVREGFAILLEQESGVDKALDIRAVLNGEGVGVYISDDNRILMETGPVAYAYTLPFRRY